MSKDPRAEQHTKKGIAVPIKDFSNSPILCYQHRCATELCYAPTYSMPNVEYDEWSMLHNGGFGALQFSIHHSPLAG
jgi:hypothetical protein